MWFIFFMLLISLYWLVTCSWPRYKLFIYLVRINSEFFFFLLIIHIINSMFTNPEIKDECCDSMCMQTQWRPTYFPTLIQTKTLSACSLFQFSFVWCACFQQAPIVSFRGKKEYLYTCVLAYGLSLNMERLWLYFMWPQEIQ